ncbi:MAG: HDIG domain-containing metalloprotein [Eubacteriaceae bacterium]
MRNTKHFREFEIIVSDILENSEFQKLKEIDHHGNGLYDHSVAVGYNAYRVAKTLGMDYEAVARGALLHDFFVEPWKGKEKQEKGWRRIKEMHGFSHPKTALENAKKHFEIDEKQADMIVKHMFPLTLSPPKYLGSWVVTAVDKVVATREMIVESNRPMRHLKKLVLRRAA